LRFSQRLPLNLPDEIYIGCKNREGHNPWLGQIMEVGIWNRPLQPWEIFKIYQNGKNNSKGLLFVVPEPPVSIL
jgi:hypothetical protein